jgi:hypothetical protein
MGPFTFSLWFVRVADDEECLVERAIERRECAAVGVNCRRDGDRV